MPSRPPVTPSKLTDEEWVEARALFETGTPKAHIGRKFGVSANAILKRSRRDNWSPPENVENEIRARTHAKVAGVDSGVTGTAKERALDAEAAKRAEVIERQRGNEINAIRAKLYDALKAHGQAENLSAKKVAFEDLKAAKISSEVLANVHAMERRAWGLDEPETEAAKGPQEIKVRYVAQSTTH